MRMTSGMRKSYRIIHVLKICNMQRRREFIKTIASGTAAVAIGGIASGISPRSYRRILGSNDRIHVAIIGLGRRYGEYKAAIANKENNIELLYLCDVMRSQREKGRPADIDYGTTAHIVNFFNAVRGKEKLNSPIEIGRVSNLLCNYANISYRTGKSFEIDPTSGHILDKQAMELWKRDYEPGWEPRIL
jgi:hypothetical protein